MPPTINFELEEVYCSNDNGLLKVLKTDTRKKITLHIGEFFARETFLYCQKCNRIYRSKELNSLVPPSGNFGYDIIVYVGKALFVQHLADQTIVEKLASKNISISPSEIAYLGKKFIVYLTLAHRQSASRIKAAMALKGGYILHLDSTYENKSPLLMIALDSIMKIVLGNIKISTEKSDSIIPFLCDIRDLFGNPLALVHDMSKGILKAVRKVFPDILDLICHFHFLRDIGKDLLCHEYDNIRNALKKHGISSKLNKRLRSLDQIVDENPELIDILEGSLQKSNCCDKSLKNMPVLAAYSLIYWALDGKKQGDAYGFPFDRPHLEFAQRLKIIHAELDQLRKIQLRNDYRDNKILHKAFFDLKDIISNKHLWKNVKTIESEMKIFDDLREAMRIAPKKGKQGLNHNGISSDIRTIEQRVKNFRDRTVTEKKYSENTRHQKLIEQIDKYWEKLFADPIEVDTPEGKVQIQPQRTNNFAEQGIRSLKRGYRKKTGNNALGKTLYTMLANTPLVKNLQNDEYMSILLNGRSNLEELFAEIDITEVREELIKSQYNPNKIPSKLKKMTSKNTFPEKLKKVFVSLKSNGILC